MIITDENFLAHYGILRRSGRYPWGSGGTAVSRSRSFLGMVEAAHKEGLSQVEIARGFGMTTSELRAAKSIARNQTKQADIGMAQRLKDKNYSNVAIGKRMGINESSVRALLEPGAKDKADILQTTSKMLKDRIDETDGFIDVSKGVEHLVGVSADKLKVAVAMLKEEGYQVHTIQNDQLGTRSGQKTYQKLVCPPGTTYKDIVTNKDRIQQITSFSEDHGRTYLGIHPPIAVDPKRVDIVYAKDGGADADGVIYVRPGVPDISIGSNHYAQVRILVGDAHYLKGMAVYKNDLPKGVDLQFNTNKNNTGNKLDAMKAIKDDPDNPFGSTIRQLVDRDANGKEFVTSAMNIVGVKDGSGAEGSWGNWSKTLSSQFLSKQSPILARQQLAMTYEQKKDQFNDILALTNPTVRRKLMETFADEVDSSAVHLKAAALPRTANRVLLPINSLKENEVYSPSHNNGEKVVLIRHPHGGTFEIPELIVNNRNKEAVNILGNDPRLDAIGINSKVAKRLSGADFDGDNVLVIPNNSGRVKSTAALEKLRDFDPQASYPAYEGMRKMSPHTKQTQMGEVSNLITDMTIRGANTDEIARAVRHSMVVIDAEKHNLNYKQSAIDNGIKQLKDKYQTPYQSTGRAGASTLISRAGSKIKIPEQKPRSFKDGGPIDPKTGKKVYVQTGESYVNAKGKLIVKTSEFKKLAITDDAHTLSSGTPIEKIYADHSNQLKALANLARKEAIHTPALQRSDSAKKIYAEEVKALNAKLNVAERNAPLERQAQVLAKLTVGAKVESNPHMDAADLKKLRFQALEEARIRTGAKKKQVEITESEWNAIQAGAISNTKLQRIMNNTDLDQLKKLATPKDRPLMTSTKTARAKGMVASGYTQAEIASALGVSLSTLKSSLE